MQGFAPKLAKGEIASLAGAQDDARHFQISAPIQPGNSGDALVDERGNVIGVVVAKLSQQAALATSGSRRRRESLTTASVPSCRRARRWGLPARCRQHFAGAGFLPGVPRRPAGCRCQKISRQRRPAGPITCALKLAA